MQGPIDFSEIGVLSSLVQPLARAGVSIFVLSTYDTDYFFVKERSLSKAIDLMTREGYEVRQEV